jgi:hypothetical protein
VKFIDKNSYKSNLTNSIEAFFGIEANSPAPQAAQQERGGFSGKANGFGKKAPQAEEGTEELETIEMDQEADEVSNQTQKGDDSKDAA